MNRLPARRPRQLLLRRCTPWLALGLGLAFLLALLPAVQAHWVRTLVISGEIQLENLPAPSPTLTQTAPALPPTSTPTQVEPPALPTPAPNPTQTELPAVPGPPATDPPPLPTPAP